MNVASPARPIVVNASIATWTVLPVVADTHTTRLFVEWRQSHRQVIAPMLWLAECVSAIREIVYAGVISSNQGRTAVEDLLALEVDAVPMDHQQCRSAFEWAERLGQARACDGFYLALAQELMGELWTADQRLVNAARQAGATWVHGIRTA